MATNSDRPRKKRNLTDFSDDLPTPERVEREQKMLKSFGEREEALRTLITCKICFRLLYEPFTNECGHSYCYTCLCQWFKNAPRGRKTCPDCRKKLTHAPSPAYALRELTRELTSRSELLPPEESVEGHNKFRKEESDALEKDRANTNKSEGGLFSGCFKSSGSRAGIHDDEDHVYRCPHCAWELDENLEECYRCGAVLNVSDDGSDIEIDDDMLDYDVEFHRSMAAWANGEDGYNDSDSSQGPVDWEAVNQIRGVPRLINVQRPTQQHTGRVLNRHRYRDVSDGEEDDEENNSDYGSSLNDFIDNEDEHNEDGESNDEEGVEEDEEGTSDEGSDRSSNTSRSTTRQSNTRMPRRTRYTVVDSDEESDNARTATSETDSQDNSRSSQTRPDNTSAASDDDSTDSAPRRRYVRRPRRRVVEDEEDEEDDPSAGGSTASAD